MKSLKNFIYESVNINLSPKSNKELKALVNKLIKERGKNADLNDIDVSNVDDMSELFAWSNFNGNISGWDVSNVEDMQRMFYNSSFNGDISGWDVSNVEDMSGMFYDSMFDGDLSKWNVNKNVNMSRMFDGNRHLEKNPPKWYK